MKIKSLNGYTLHVEQENEATFFVVRMDEEPKRLETLEDGLRELDRLAGVETAPEPTKRSRSRPGVEKRRQSYLSAEDCIKKLPTGKFTADSLGKHLNMPSNVARLRINDLVARGFIETVENPKSKLTKLYRKTK